MSDAHQLAKLVEGFTNQRSYRMRAELRARIGEALRIPDRRRARRRRWRRAATWTGRSSRGWVTGRCGG
jgi:hypothetical protein